MAEPVATTGEPFGPDSGRTIVRISPEQNATLCLTMGLAILPRRIRKLILIETEAGRRPSPPPPSLPEKTGRP